jgi:hypothetical protein
MSRHAQAHTGDYNDLMGQRGVVYNRDLHRQMKKIATNREKLYDLRDEADREWELATARDLKAREKNEKILDDFMILQQECIHRGNSFFQNRNALDEFSRISGYIDNVDASADAWDKKYGKVDFSIIDDSVPIFQVTMEASHLPNEATEVNLTAAEEANAAGLFITSFDDESIDFS